MHHIIARITSEPNACEAVLAALTDLARESQKETGNARYDLFQVEGQPHVFMTVEVWENKAAADHHMKSPHLQAALAKAGPLLAARPEILQVNPKT